MQLKINRLGLRDLPLELTKIPRPPRWLYYQGNLDALKAPCLAVVGTRKITPYGKSVTTRLVENISRRGITIISGLAFGVDACAHRAAIDAGGRTVAVLAGGLDNWYPTEHHHLAQSILDNGGAIVSEYLEGTKPQKYSFIARNRLVSGLSKAVLITEAGLKSGTLHTANFALEQGRDVMAVPGDINSDASVGTNNLIKTGAIPITSPQDLLDYFGIDEKYEKVKGSNEQEQAVLDAISAGATTVDEIIKHSGLDIIILNQTFTMLEITGKASQSFGQWSLC